MKKGDRVLIKGKHPHAGRYGMYIKSTDMNIAGTSTTAYLVEAEFDNNIKFFVFDKNDIEVIPKRTKEHKKAKKTVRRK